jgi:hypothetical protein
MPEGLCPFNCNDRNDPRNKFVRRINKDCCIPAGYVGLTNMDHPCRFHCDELNFQLLQYDLVPAFSKFVEVYRETYQCALIGHSQRSVDEYLVRTDVHGTCYVNLVRSEYLLFQNERKQITLLLFLSGVPVKSQGMHSMFPCHTASLQYGSMGTL